MSSVFLTKFPAKDYAAAPDECPETAQERENMVPMKEVPGERKNGERESKEDEAEKKEGNCETRGHQIGNPGSLVMIKSVEVWLWITASVLAYLGWTFFNINFVSNISALGTLIKLYCSHIFYILRKGRSVENNSLK